MKTSFVRTAVVVGAAALAMGVLAPMAGATHGASEDQKTAKAGLLVESDFPTGWTEEPTTANAVSTLQKATADAGSACTLFAKSVKLASTQPNATSSIFTDDTSTAQNYVVVFKKSGDASKTLTAFKSSSMRNCLATTLPKILPAALALNPAVGKVSSVTVKVTPGKTAPIANSNAAWESTATVKTKKGKKATVSINTEAVQDGRAVDLFEFTNAGTTQLDGVHDHLIASSVGRIEGALGVNALGETPELAAALVPVVGYTYTEASPAQQLDIMARLTDQGNDVLIGQSLHSVVSGSASVGEIMMTEADPSYAGEPGFKENSVTEWLSSDFEAFGAGTTATSTVNGHQVTTGTFADGSVEWVFWNHNILVAIYGPDPATTQPFVDGFLAATPA